MTVLFCDLKPACSFKVIQDNKHIYGYKYTLIVVGEKIVIDYRKQVCASFNKG